MDEAHDRARQSVCSPKRPGQGNIDYQEFFDSQQGRQQIIDDAATIYENLIWTSDAPREKAGVRVFEAAVHKFMAHACAIREPMLTPADAAGQRLMEEIFIGGFRRRMVTLRQNESPDIDIWPSPFEMWRSYEDLGRQNLDGLKENLQLRYSPINVRAKDIRLLELAPGKRDMPLEGHLIVVSLNTEPIFDAVSYMAGKSSERVLLGCSNESAGHHWSGVAPNTLKALRDIRDEEKPIRLWIRDLCINQRDSDERKMYVGMTKCIYTQAQWVRVWIDQFLDPMEPCVKHLAQFEAIAEQEEEIEITMATLAKNAHVLLGHDPSLWNPLDGIMADDYWTRLWTQQELLMANHVVVHCQSTIITGTGLFTFQHALAEVKTEYVSPTKDPERHALNSRWEKKLKHIVSLAIPSKSFISYRRDYRDWMKAAAVADSKGGPIPYIGSLLNLVLELGKLHTSDPRDRIFALYGLAHDIDPLLADGDYDWTIARTFRYALDRCKKHNYVEYLPYVRRCSDQVQWRGSNGSLYQSFLPTWIPNWMDGLLTKSKFEPFRHEASGPRPCPLGRDRFLKDDEWCMRVRAIKLDGLRFAYPPVNGRAQKILDIFDHLDALSPGGDLILGTAQWLYTLMYRSSTEYKEKSFEDEKAYFRMYRGDFAVAFQAFRDRLREASLRGTDMDNLQEYLLAADQDGSFDKESFNGGVRLMYVYMCRSDILTGRIVLLQSHALGIAENPLKSNQEYVLSLGSASTSDHHAVLEARLEQANLLKKVVDAIKDLVQDCNFDCNDSGIALQAMDNSHVALVSMMLKSESFSPFRCDRNIALGINLTSLQKVLRCANSEDILTLKAEDAPDVVNLVFESADSDRLSEYDIKLMDIDQEHLGIPETEYAANISMPSAEFQKICRDLMALSESVAIECTKEGVKFSCNGDIGSGSVTLRSHTNVDKPENNVEIDLTEPVALTFSLKYLVNFCKASGLSGQVKLCLSNEVPLLVEYGLASNSYLRFYLAPKIGDDE
ncbi:hypothetical protein EJ05DRAFT_502109 [Pseudovirgaria hyperparasitica]|uniref:DNA sliding clamp PCNA n=1 Tax=Pseudovirgaria hyperparasitica TaxID=470096 RepID=A0A6A6W129_9PEZI|nr:uncharacterized protein EJ05DRAFT_502109 [Pseudovirgaria hyperparasitica]KAF2756612.1 hypothetical protein EJ05DRAFT_502109 [Pseudovirgaria hyperparasitica]